MSKEVTVTFQGELGVELNVDRASGAVRMKRAEADSPAKPHEGATLRSINGKPIGKIVDKAAWLELVERLKAPARPLVLALEVPEDPVQRARAELDALAASAKAEAEAAAAASAPAPTRGRAFSRGVRFGPRSRSPSPELTCKQCKRKGTRADGFFSALVGCTFCSEACKAKSLTRLDLERAERVTRSHRERASKLGTHPLASSARRRLPRSRSRSPRRRRESSRSRSRSPRRRRASSPPRRNRHEAAAAPAAPPAAPGIDEQRPTRRHLVDAPESSPALQPPVESEPAARGPTGDYIREPPGDAEIFDMVLAREKARIVKDYAAADRMRAEMAAAGLIVVYRDVTGRGDKNRGAVTWSTVDGRAGPPSLSTAEIESRLRAWLHARNVEKNPSRATALLADCAARGLGTSASGTGQWTWFTAQGQHGPMPSLVRDARSPRSRGDENDRGGAQRLRGVYRASVRYGAQGNETRRYGFITPAGLEPDTRTDVFMHADDVREGHIVKHGDSVEYTLVPCLRTGKDRAADVVKLRFWSPELSLEGTIAARTKRILAGDHGIRAQFDDRTLTVRTLRAAVAKSLGVDAEQAAVKKVVKQTLMDALEAKARRPRGVFNLVPRGFKRFGFITPDGGGEDMFAHLENVRAGHVVEDRNAVEYGIGRGPDGRDQAVDIVPVPSPPPPPSEASEDSGAAAPVLVIDVGSPRKRGR